MKLKTTLLAAGSALVLSAGIAAAAPAVATTDLNLRSGPGPNYQVVGTIPDGATVDVAGCTGSWCQVNFDGTTGYASASYLSGTGGAVGPSAGIVVQPGYDTYDNNNYAYDDGYYDDGPSVGFYASPGFRNRGFHRNPGWNGNNRGWNGNRVGGNFNGGGVNRGGFAGRTGGRQMSAPAGLRTGGGFNPGAAAVGSRGTAVQAGGGGGGAVSAPAGGGGGGFAGSIVGGGQGRR